MDGLIGLLNDYREYIFGAMGLLVMLVMLNIILNRPIHEEKDHQMRYQRLKEKNKNRYKDLRPLR